MNILQAIATWLSSQAQHLHQTYIQLLDVNNIEKSRIVSAVLIFFHALFYISISTNRHFELFNPVMIPNILMCFQIFLLVSLILFLLSYRIKAHRRSEFYFPILCVGFYSGSLMTVGYIAGMMTVLTGVFTIGSILAGLLLFERRIMFYASLPCLVVFYLTSILTVLHILPYAPLYQPLTMIVASTQTYFILVNLVATTLIGIILVILFNSFLDRWMERERKQRDQMNIDPLTQLLNRRGIDQIFDRLQQHSSSIRSDHPGQLYLVLIDIDHFKAINDQYGHDCGDQVLVQLSHLLRLNTRAADHIGRFGGEEFLIIFEQSDFIEVTDILERCRQAIEQHRIYYQAQCVQVTASFGLSHSQQHGCDVQQVLLSADQALYRAKASGRNQICIAST